MNLIYRYHKQNIDKLIDFELTEELLEGEKHILFQITNNIYYYKTPTKVLFGRGSFKPVIVNNSKFTNEEEIKDIVKEEQYYIIDKRRDMLCQ